MLFRSEQKTEEKRDIKELNQNTIDNENKDGAMSEDHPKKKKNIIFVSNPQNSKMPGQPSRQNQVQRPAGGQRPNQQFDQVQKPTTQNVSQPISADKVKEAFAAALQTNKEEPKKEVQIEVTKSVEEVNTKAVNEQTPSVDVQEIGRASCRERVLRLV